MIPFLRRIAREYVANHTPDILSEFCFVFPNKRSATFFLRYLDLEIAAPHIEPEVTTIGDFIGSLSPLAEAPRFLQLATLYEAYRSIAPESVPDFDRFMFWGEILLADFGDVDRYLANPRELFSNIEELREINSTYLTETQREIIQRYWGEEAPGLRFEPRGEHDEAERFWTHVPVEGEEGSNAEKFISLWRVLDKVYDRFNAMLAEDGYATSGHLFRHAATKLKKDGAGALPHPAKRYIFVGFNMLSTAEVVIFDALKRAGIADFYWDIASPAFTVKGNKAGNLAIRGAGMFPSLYDISEPASHLPEIEIIGVASGVGQAKVGADYLEKWKTEGYIGAQADSKSGTDTAVVLADESLLMPVIGHLPASIEPVNITMGFPMKLTPLAAVMHSAVVLQKRVRSVGARQVFFYEDVMALLSQPVVRSVAPDECEAILREIEERRLFSLDAIELAEKYPRLAPLFRPLSAREAGSLDDSASYFIDLIELFSAYATEQEHAVERRFLMAYRASLDELVAAFRYRGVTMKETTMAALIERALATATVNFKGEPLRGVQIMGVLETRALDFENVVMLSMNESVFPRRHSRPSFIPEALRNAFGLPGKDMAETMFGYLFFRLMSRARRVALLYDSRTSGVEKIGEMSRYLSQLLYLFPGAEVKHIGGVFPKLPGESRTALSVEKTPEVMARLEEFKRVGSGKNLSASSLNTYINCPLQFYLESVEGLKFKSETESSDYIDWSTYGQIVHEVAERLYISLAEESGDSTIHREALKAASKDKVRIDRLVTAAVNRHYLHLSLRDEPDRFDELRGESKVLGGIMVELIQRMLYLESETFPDFEFKGAEVQLNGQVRLSPDVAPLNIRQVIDRIDFAGPGGSMRFVDYKTGGDELKSDSVMAAFDSNLDHRPKVLFQLLFYCYCYSQLTGYDGPIQPFVYLTRSLFTQPLDPLTIGNRPSKVINDYREYIDEFKTLLAGMINKIFDDTTPFTALVNDPGYDGRKCKFCRFKPICSPPESKR